MENKPWRRYRFNTYSLEDPRPLVFNPRYPWWLTGQSVKGLFNKGTDYATIVAYLPAGEDLLKYWDDAFEITVEECDEITFSDRLSKPKYFVREVKVKKLN